MKNKTKRRIRFFGFTLVEMLIVVVILGILSSVLLPKITGFMAKTRDLKRQMDLRAIATELEIYKNNHGELPFFSGGYIPESGCTSKKFFTNAIDLAPFLNLPNFPKDPQKVKVNITNKYHSGFNHRLLAGEYLYALRLKRPHNASYYTELKHLYLKGGIPVGLLVAKTETADASNFVLATRECSGYQLGCGFMTYDGGGSRGCFPPWAGPDVYLCSKIIKGSSAERIQQSDGSYHCTYTSSDQLYYIHVVE